MNLRHAISRFFLLPIGKTYSGRKYFKALRYQKFLEETQFWNRSAIEDLQNEQFSKLISHCYVNVPFYRKYMDKMGLTINDFQSIIDLKKLSLLSKETLKYHIEELRACNYKDRMINYRLTGGTTGIPVKVGLDLINEYKVDGNNWRFWKYAGYISGMKALLFWAHPLELNLSNSLHMRLKNLMENIRIFNFWGISETNLIRASNYFDKAKPDIIRGYASSVLLFVQFCKEKGIHLKHSPNSIIITADKISDYQKLEISDFFRCEVFNEYGSREFGFLAQECEVHQGYHLAEELFVFEVFNQDTKETQFTGTGELVVTQLYNYAMPLIRFRTGDEVTISSQYCPCGRNLKYISELKGRTLDYIITKSDRLVHGTFFLFLFGESQGIARFQIHQYEKGWILIYIIKNKNFNEKEIDEILDILKDHFQDDLSYKIKYVTDVEISPSGKRRICISHLASQLSPGLPVRENATPNETSDMVMAQINS